MVELKLIEQELKNHVADEPSILSEKSQGF